MFATAPRETQIDFDLIKQFNYLDQWWVRLGYNCLNIGWKALPADVHLTVSFHSHSPFINVHLSRNFPSQGRKPAIEILRIDKELLSDYLENQAGHLMQQLLEPCALPTYFKSDQDVWFFPFSVLQQEDHPEIVHFNTFIRRKLQSASSAKGRHRMKVHTELEKVFAGLGSGEKFYRFFDFAVTRLPSNLATCSRSGIIVAERKNRIYLLLHGKTYDVQQMTVSTSPLELLLGAAAAQQLQLNFAEAVEVIKNSTSYEEAQSAGILPVVIG